MTTFTKMITEAYYKKLSNEATENNEHQVRIRGRIADKLNGFGVSENNYVINVTDVGYLVTFNDDDAPKLLAESTGMRISFQVRGVCRNCKEGAWSNSVETLEEIGWMHLDFNPGWTHTCATDEKKELTPIQELTNSLTKYIDSCFPDEYHK
jgi:hypothetical protein